MTESPTAGPRLAAADVCRHATRSIRASRNFIPHYLLQQKAPHQPLSQYLQPSKLKHFQSCANNIMLDARATKNIYKTSRCVGYKNEYLRFVAAIDKSCVRPALSIALCAGGVVVVNVCQRKLRNDSCGREQGANLDSRILRRQRLLRARGCDARLNSMRDRKSE